LTETEVTMVTLVQQMAASKPPNDEAPAESPPKLGAEAAEKMDILTVSAAKEVVLLGKTVVDLAAEIDAECKELAENIISHGKIVSQHIRDFAVLAKKVGLSNRETRKRIFGETHQAEAERDQNDEDKPDDEAMSA